MQAGATNAFSSASAVSVGGGALLDLNGFNQAVASLSGAGTVGNTGGPTATLITGADNTSTTFSGSTVDDGPVGLTKTGSGTLTLSGTNTYAGATDINRGTLQAGALNMFSAASAFNVAAGAFLDLNGFNQAIGSLAGAGTVTNAGGAAATLTTGADNTSTTFGGVIQDGASAIALTMSGTGSLTLSGVNTYSGTTTINAGTLSVTGDISSSSGVTVNTGGTLNGTGTVSGVTVNNGGSLAPGLSPAIGSLAINGNLLLASAATYMVTVSPAGASSVANISGSASLGGTLAVTPLPGSYAFGTKYTVLTTTGAGLVSRTFAGTTVTGSFGANVKPVLSYDAHDVFLTLDLIASLPTLPTSASGNQTNPANAINAFIAAGGTLPPGFLSLANLPPSQLAAALTQLSGEANAGAGQAASFQISNQFLLAMLNPFGSDRSGSFGAAGFGPAGTGAVSQYAPTRNVSPEVAQAYAAVTPRSEDSVPFSTRWNVWALAFGGANNTNGDPNGSGSHNTSSRTAGVAAGLDYKPTPDTMLGFALAGGGTGWGGAGGAMCSKPASTDRSNSGRGIFRAPSRSRITGWRPAASSPFREPKRSPQTSSARVGVDARKPDTRSRARPSISRPTRRSRRRVLQLHPTARAPARAQQSSPCRMPLAPVPSRAANSAVGPTKGFWLQAARCLTSSVARLGRTIGNPPRRRMRRFSGSRRSQASRSVAPSQHPISRCSPLVRKSK